MRILIVSTLKRRIGPDQFASRSRIIYELSSGLVKKGHEVSILGTADSVVPGAKIIPVLEKGWVDLPPVENEFLRETASLINQSRKMVEVQDSFDMVHNHSYPDFFPSVLQSELRVPLVTTLHALYDDYMEEVLSKSDKTYFIALSNGYKKLYEKVKIYDVAYNGVDTNLYAFKKEKQDYMLWLGRLPRAKNADGTFMDPKGVRWAIQLARETGSRLIVYGVCEDKKFFETDVKPYLNDKIQWVGDVSSEQSLSTEKVVELMQNARVFLMTINQQEPFGLVMAEAMSCGTPVIGFNRGSVGEVVIDGKTGFTVNPDEGIEGLKRALEKISSISPEDCRGHVENNFSLDSMVEKYERIYLQILKKNENSL